MADHPLDELPVATDLVGASTYVVQDGTDKQAPASLFGAIGGSTGSNDNRLLRADGTGGKTIQASAVSVDDSGNVGSATITALGQIKAQSGSGTAAAMVLGADVNATTITTSTQKVGRMTMPAYNTGQPLVTIMAATALSGDNQVNFGGIDFASTQQATQISFCTAAAVNTVSANVRLRIGSGGGVFHPSATGTDKGDNTINFGAVYDDNSLLTCMAMSREFIEDGSVDLAKWDALVPDLVVPEQRGEIEVMWPVLVAETVAVDESDAEGRIVRRFEVVQREVDVPAVIADPVYNGDGRIIDAVETPLLDEVVIPEQVIRREHRTARVFQAMLDSGFDPRDPEQYFAKMRDDEALPGMPTKVDWVHNALSTGELMSQQWLAIEMLAIVTNVMWAKMKDIEVVQQQHAARLEVLEG